MKRIQKNTNVIVDQVEGSTMLCDTASVAFFRLNATGALVWEICDNRGVDEIAARLGEVYSTEDPGMLRTVVERFLESLTEAGLVVIEEQQQDYG